MCPRCNGDAALPEGPCYILAKYYVAVGCRHPPRPTTRQCACGFFVKPSRHPMTSNYMRPAASCEPRYRPKLQLHRFSKIQALAADPLVGSFGASCHVSLISVRLATPPPFSRRLARRRFPLPPWMMRARPDWTWGTIPSLFLVLLSGIIRPRSNVTHIAIITR